MAIEKLYPDDPDNEKGERRHKPEVIIPDDDYERAQLEKDISAVKIRSSLVLRFLMFLLTFLGALTLAFNLLVLTAHTILVLATFFRSPVFVEVWHRTMRAVKRWAVISTGALIAILFPGVGITFMLSYFFVSSDTQRQQLFMKMFRNHMDTGDSGQGGPYWS